MDLTQPTPTQPPNPALGIMLAVILTAVLTAVGVYLFMNQTVMKQADELKQKNDEIARLQLQVKQAETATVPNQDRYVAASCRDATVAKTFQYSYDDPRDYLGPFLDSLLTGNVPIAKQFLADASVEDSITIDKSYRGYLLAVSSWKPDTGDVTVSITDPGNVTSQVVFHTRKFDGCWRVTGVVDTNGVLH